jgi:3-oxoacyl-[acyl-carrier-protein] synthase II
MISGLGFELEDSFAQLMQGATAIRRTPNFELPGGREIHAAAISPEMLSEALAASGVSSSGQCRSQGLAFVAATRALRLARLDGVTLDITLGASTGATHEGITASAQALPVSVVPMVKRLLSEPLGELGQRLASEIAATLAPVRSSTVVCSACSSGALAIALGAMRLEQGVAIPQLVGGVDSLNLLTLCGFESLGALSGQPCRPFDEQRSGLSLGEGAGFVVLETEAMVQRRGATVLAWLDGYAVGSEAHHLTHPEAEGTRAMALIRAALVRAELLPRDIGYINAHGTATLVNDAMESEALRGALGADIDTAYVSSSKGQIGHTLAAAGAIEAVITAQALIEQAVPPTAGLERPAAGCELRHVPQLGVHAALGAALSTSFGFGGAGAVLALRRSNVDGKPARGAPATDGELACASDPLCISAVVAIGPRGILGAAELVEWLDAPEPGERQALPFDPLDRLVMERSRRFDRITALTSLGAASALAAAGLGDEASRHAADATVSGEVIGMVVGNACGAVGRTAAFVERVLKRGQRGANPAEFPHLLPSSLSGNASIYARLRGPCFSVSDSGPTLQSALALAVACVRSGMATAMLAGTTEARDETVAELLGSDAPDLMCHTDIHDGSAWLVVEQRATAVAREQAYCLLLAHGWCSELDTEATEACKPSVLGDEWVLTEGDSSEINAWLERLGWSHQKQVTVPMRRHDGWTRPGFVLAAGVSLVLTGRCRGALVVTAGQRGLHCVRLATTNSDPRCSCAE